MAPPARTPPTKSYPGPPTTPSMAPTPSKYVSSILDTDLYKLTMQQAVFHHYPKAQAVYKFMNRNLNMKFTWPCVQAIIGAINRFEDITLQEDELEWLREKCPYLQPNYLEYLRNFRFKPKDQVTVRFIPSLSSSTTDVVGDLEIEFKGLWLETILYETPVMAIVSEAFFTHVDTDWSMSGQEELAYSKGKAMYEGGIALSELGSRRRRSYETQQLVLEGLIRAHNERTHTGQGGLAGTSNVHFARTYNLVPIGTIAHEWIMAVAAIQGYENVNSVAMRLWEQVYPLDPSNAHHIALTDTFTSKSFFQDVMQDVNLAKRWRGLRQDSGDPLQFVIDAKNAYTSIGIDPKEKVVTFSDSLNLGNCFIIKKALDEAGFLSGFGIGTFLTSDFKKVSSTETSDPMNIVVKIRSVNGTECIKISDDVLKQTGDKASVRSVMDRLKIHSPVENETTTPA